MKRTLCFLCAALLLLLCACGSNEVPAPSDTPTPPPVSETPTQPSPSPTAEPTEEPSPAPTEAPTEEPPVEVGPVNPLTGLPMREELVGQKPVAIMLNNIKAAMPQQGNSQADIIYEVLAEGGITRMLGIYQDISQLGIVGSVRSARPYFLDLALGHDAIYVHAGGSEIFYQRKKAEQLDTIDGVNGYYSHLGLFWRDRSRIPGNYYAYEHSLITSGEKLTEVLTANNVFAPHREGYTYDLTFAENIAPVDGDLVSVITVPFSGYKTTIFRYNEETRTYWVEQHGQPYIDGNDGSQISVTNVLVLNAECTVLDSGGHLSVDLSSGKGWFSCGGTIRPITWEKGDKDQPIRYFDEFGQPLTLGVGKSFVCIIPLSRDITVELVQP